MAGFSFPRSFRGNPSRGAVLSERNNRALTNWLEKFAVRLEDDGVTLILPDWLITPTFPILGGQNTTAITSFTTNAYTTTDSVVLWTHDANRTVKVKVDWFPWWEETAAVSYTGITRCSISLDGGSTWSDGPGTRVIVGGNANAQARSAGATGHYLAGSATGDIQVRAQYFVGAGAVPTKLNAGTLSAIVTATA